MQYAYSSANYLSVFLAVTSGCASFRDRGVPDRGMTSSTHEKNVGKIVFAPAEIEFQKEDPSTFRTAFKLGDPIYARLYLQRSPERVLLRAGKKEVPVEDAFDSEPKYSFEISASRNGKALGATQSMMGTEWTTYNFVLARTADDTKKWPERESKWFIEQILPELASGANEVRLEVTVTDAGGAKVGEPVAAGTLTIEVAADKEAAITSIRKRSENAAAVLAEKDRQAKAEFKAHIDAGERSVMFGVSGDCGARFGYRTPAGKTGMEEGGMWLPKGTKIVVCVASTQCGSFDIPYAVVAESPDKQAIAYHCP
jgi:hypothetical protein